MTGILVLAGLFAALLFGVDIAFALAGVGIVMLVLGDFSTLIVAQTMMASIDNFILLAVPLFRYCRSTACSWPARGWWRNVSISGLPW